MEFKKEQNKQEAKDINNSNVNIINGNITNYNGISYSDATNICKDICAFEIERNSKIAVEMMEQRLKDYSNACIQRISLEAKEFLDRFKEPDIQYSLRKSVVPYLRTGDTELKEDLINIFIDRLRESERSTKQAIIEEAIEIIPSLSQASIALLATIVFSYFNRHFYHYFEKDIETMPLVTQHLVNINNLDIDHLVQQRCAIGGFSGITFNASLEDTFQKNYDLYFRKPMTTQFIQDTFYNFPAQIDGLAYFVRDAINSNLVRHNFNNSSYLKEQMLQFGQQGFIGVYDKYLSENPCMNNLEIRNALISKNKNWQYAFKALNMNEVKAITLTPVGKYIGISYLRRKLNFNFSFNLFYPVK